MQLKNLVGSLLLVGAIGGCYAEGDARVAVVAPAPQVDVEVDEEPPPPREAVVVERPGFVFITGRWYRNGSQWAWREGYYERERRGYHWVQGHWDRRGRRHAWIEGHWIR